MAERVTEKSAKALGLPMAPSALLRLRERLETAPLAPSGSAAALPMTLPSRRNPFAVPDGKVGPVASTKSCVGPA
jgi:hypothetical protein